MPGPRVLPPRSTPDMSVAGPLPVASWWALKTSSSARAAAAFPMSLLPVTTPPIPVTDGPTSARLPAIKLTPVFVIVVLATMA